MNECTPEPGSGERETMQSTQVGVGRPLEFGVLASGGAGGPTGRTSGSLPAQARFRTHTGLASRLGSESAPLTPLCFADERDPAGHGLHQAQPLGQEQPVFPPRGPVPCVSRGCGPGLPAAQSTAPQTKCKTHSAFAGGTSPVLSGCGVTATPCVTAPCPAMGVPSGSGPTVS